MHALSLAGRRAPTYVLTDTDCHVSRAPYTPSKHTALVPYRTDGDTELHTWHDSVASLMACLPPPRTGASSLISPFMVLIRRKVLGMHLGCWPREGSKGGRLRGIKSQSKESTIEDRDKHRPHWGDWSAWLRPASVSHHLLLLADPSGSGC